MPPFNTNPNIAIDKNHAALITALIVCHKPIKCLEIGVGSGRGSDAILAGLEYNEQPYDFTMVDCWAEPQWRNCMPQEIYDKYHSRANIVTSREKEYLMGCGRTFEWIFLDSDHDRSQEWFKYVYDNILEKDGILIYHDINIVENAYVNLREILYTCQRENLTHVLFNKNSLPGIERCQRGLLVIFKNK